MNSPYNTVYSTLNKWSRKNYHWNIWKNGRIDPNDLPVITREIVDALASEEAKAKGESVPPVRSIRSEL